MTQAPKDSPAHRRLLSEGRGRMALLVAGALVSGAAAATEVGATPTDPAVIAACADPERMGPTVTVAGLEVDCDPSGETTTTEPATTTTEAAPPPPPPAAQSEPAASSASPPPPAPTPDPAPPVPAPPAPVAPPATGDPAPGARTTATPTTPAEPATPPPATERSPLATPGSPEAKAKALRELKAEHRALDRAKARARSRTRAERKVRTVTKAKVRAKARATSERRKATSDAATYAALPAAWTSLRPLTLPSFALDGFPIPPFLLPIYQAAAAQYGVPWEVLASINEIETDFGRNARVSSAGALGWMQFIPSSWAEWGTDGDGDGRRDPRNPVDAIFAAANYLDDAGAGTDLPRAIFAYNHADWYVNKVVSRARQFASLDPALVAALTWRALREDTDLYRAHGNPFAGDGATAPSAGQVLLLTKAQLQREVLRSDTIRLYAGGRQDVAMGVTNRRVLATLLFLDRSGLHPTVSSLTTGHSIRTSGGRISAHSYGHAVDIAAINGTPIIGNQGAGSITAKTLDKLVQLQGYLQPDQIISLMTIEGRANTLAMGDHDDHIHVGFPRVADVPAGRRPADVLKLVAAFRDAPRRVGARVRDDAAN